MAAFLNGCLSDLGCPKDQFLAPYCFYYMLMSYIKLFITAISNSADDIALYKEIKSPS